MKDFTFRFERRDFSDFLSKPDLTYVVERYSHEATGGPKECYITAYGVENELWRLLNMLRVPITVYGDDGDPVWWGCIAEIEVRIGWINVTLDIENMSNRISVTYSSLGTRDTTSWEQDDVSVNEYGIKERMVSLSDGTKAEAEARRQTVLQSAKYPVGSSTFQSQGEGSYSAKIVCRGWYDSLEWQYYDQPKGLEQYAISGTGFAKLGLTYTASTIEFTSSSIIEDTASKLNNFKKDDYISVLGSEHNDGEYLLAKSGGTGFDLDIDENYSGSLHAESSACMITISTGSSIAQSFTQRSGSVWNANSVHIRAQTVGSPDGDFAVYIMDETGGSEIGGELASGCVAASAMDETTQWIEVILSSSTQLPNACQRWIKIVRRNHVTGVCSTCPHFKVDINEDAGYDYGSLLIFSGAGSPVWRTKSPEADMVFKIAGTQETTEQIREMLQNKAQFINGIDIAVNSGVETNQFREGDTTTLDEINKLLETGTSNGLRMLANINENRTFKITEEPLNCASSNFRIRSDRKLRTFSNVVMESSKIYPGVWITIEDVVPSAVDVSKIAGIDTFFMEEVDYYTQSNVFVPRAKNARNPWDTALVENK